MAKIDALDRKIIYQLDINSRQSYQQIARQVNASKESVAYRIKRIYEQELIFKNLTVIDPASLGFSLHKVMLKLENIDTKNKQEMIRYLKYHPYSLWTAECEGPFDIGFMLFGRSLTELNNILSEICNRYNNHINRRVISTNLRGEYFQRNYLVQKKRPEKQSVYGEQEQASIDETDYQILLALSEDSRTKLVDIARVLPIKIDSIRNRINKMEKKGIIKGYSIILDNAAIGQLHYKILLHLRDLSQQKFNSIREFCRQQKNITYLIKSLGTWDLEIDIEVEKPEEYRQIMLDFMQQFPNTVRSYDSIQIFKLHQYRYLPNKEVLIK